MGFWGIVGEMLVDELKKVKEKADEYRDTYDDIYSQSSERYANMSDERLEREIERLRRETGGDQFKRMSKIQAMKDELENRRGY